MTPEERLIELHEGAKRAFFEAARPLFDMKLRIYCLKIPTYILHTKTGKLEAMYDAETQKQLDEIDEQIRDLAQSFTRKSSDLL